MALFSAKAAAEAVEGKAGKAVAEAVEGKAAKSSSRSYMGQLHSTIANMGEDLGMSKKAASVVSGIGMAGAGIGAFSVANSSSENHPFLGGAAKIGIIGGAGYAALKGHGAKAIGEAAEAAAAKKAEAQAGKAASKAARNAPVAKAAGTKPVEPGPGDFLGNPRKFSPMGEPVTGFRQPTQDEVNATAARNKTGSGLTEAAGQVESSPTHGVTAATVPESSVAAAAAAPAPGVHSTTNHAMYNQPAGPLNNSANKNVSKPIGKSVGAGAVDVSGENVSPVKRNHDAERRVARKMAKGKKVN